MRYLYMENGKLKERRRRIVMAFKGRLRGNGSRYMRCDQLADFVNRYYGDTHQVSVEVLPHPVDKPGKWKKFLRTVQDATVITLKGSIDILSEEQLGELRGQAISLGIDHVDSFAGGDVFAKANLHIASNLASHEFMWKKCERISRRDRFEMPLIELVDHHADERIKAAPQPSGKQLKIVYIGNLDNTRIPPQIAPNMLQFSAEAQAGFEKVLQEIDQAHMHYCVRSDTKLRQPKPFTKGFTAALADRNLLCTPKVHDAARFLGHDYPFMTKGESDKDIIDTVEFARASIGAPEWEEGLRRVRAMREEVRPEKVAKQLVDAVDKFY